jgi:hypothetical protein
MGSVQDGDELVSVYVVPGNYYKIDVPPRILRDPQMFEAYTRALLKKQQKTPWYQTPVPAWIFLLTVGLAFLALLAATLWPLGI